MYGRREVLWEHRLRVLSRETVNIIILLLSSGRSLFIFMVFLLRVVVFSEELSVANFW